MFAPDIVTDRLWMKCMTPYDASFAAMLLGNKKSGGKDLLINAMEMEKAMLSFAYPKGIRDFQSIIPTENTSRMETAYDLTAEASKKRAAEKEYILNICRLYLD